MQTMQLLKDWLMLFKVDKCKVMNLEKSLRMYDILWITGS